MSDSSKTSDRVDTSGWVTCRQASDLLGCSEQTVRSFVQKGRLHPRRGETRSASGRREVELYDPDELATIGSQRRSAAASASDPGDQAARAFELFDEGRPMREIVVALRVLPAKITELHDQWIDLGGCDLVIARTARVELERMVGSFADVAELVDRVRAVVSGSAGSASAAGSPGSPGSTDPVATPHAPQVPQASVASGSP